MLAETFDPPLAGVLTTEPGGQLELSSQPAPLAGCIAGAAADLDRLRARAATAGLTLTGLGLDPRPSVLRTADPRVGETVLAVLRAQGSPRRAAQQLGVHENTVAKRVKSAERLLGRRIDERPAELFAALLIDRVVSGSPA